MLQGSAIDKVKPMTNSSDYEPTRHHETIVNASAVFSAVDENEKVRMNPHIAASIARDERRVIHNKQVREAGTDYDPPEPSHIDRSVQLTLSSAPQEA